MLVIGSRGLVAAAVNFPAFITSVDHDGDFGFRATGVARNLPEDAGESTLHVCGDDTDRSVFHQPAPLLQGLARKNLPSERCFTEGNKLQHPATTGIGGVKPGLRLSRGIVQNERFGEGRREMAPSPIILSFQPLRKEITKQKADRNACPLKGKGAGRISPPGPPVLRPRPNTVRPKWLLSCQLKLQLRDETTVFFQDPLQHRPLGCIFGHSLDYL